MVVGSRSSSSYSSRGQLLLIHGALDVIYVAGINEAHGGSSEARKRRPGPGNGPQRPPKGAEQDHCGLNGPKVVPKTVPERHERNMFDLNSVFREVFCTIL